MGDKKKVFIGVAWPYVNGDLHIGHFAGYLLPADIQARFQRLMGNDVLMVSGSDCHGTPITVQADKEGKTAQEIADYYHEHDVDLFLNTLKLSYDLYTRTDTKHHAQVTQDVFISLLEAGYIFIDTEEQYFSEEEQRFLPDRYIEGKCPFCGFEGARSDQCDNCGKLLDQGTLINPVSKISKSEAVLKKTQHYYLDWTKLQPKIEEYVKAVGPNWKDWVYQETLGWLREGLKPRAITRDLDWGVAIPTDRIPKDMQIERPENKRFYVWFDAVIGYLSASILWGEENGKDWEEFWYKDQAKGADLKHYYFMGKDNLVFHTMFWPGKLMTYDEDLHLPDFPSINMFLNLDGQQFSKSRGVTIDTKKMVDDYGNDLVRFYLTLVMPEKNDSSFTWDDFAQKVNSVLIGTYGNFVHRLLSLLKNVDKDKLQSQSVDDEVTDQINSTYEKAKTNLDACEYKLYLESVMNLAIYGNKRLDHVRLWELKKTNESE
ncbi:methionine--tRNA ligase, partial [candidate division WWE3 bacterium]|nr:methionine--tRNA ligase [candidate division WWE3 bacterium]